MISELTFHVLDKMLLITHNRILLILLFKLSPFGIFGKFIWVRILSNKLYRIGSLSTMILSFIQCLNKIKFFFQKSNWSRVTLTLVCRLCWKFLLWNYWRSEKFEMISSSQRFFQKVNEQIRRYYLSTCFCSFFGRRWRHQKDISKLTDL